MVRIELDYLGQLRCEARHGPSGVVLATDAPVDNQGLGASFSPTDLVATALGSCMLTTIGIKAQLKGWDVSGASAQVEKHMVSDPKRRIGKLDVVLRLPATLDERARTTLERVALTCPVHASLAAEVEIPVRFEFVEVGLVHDDVGPRVDSGEQEGYLCRAGSPCAGAATPPARAGGFGGIR